MYLLWSWYVSISVSDVREEYRATKDEHTDAFSQTYAPTPSQDSSDAAPEIKKALLWDRKTEGGFPGTFGSLFCIACILSSNTYPPQVKSMTQLYALETKVLKQRVRDHIDPKKDLGHSDVGGKKKATSEEEAPLAPGTNPRAGTQEGAAGTGDDGAVKRNADGTICEDCR